MTCWVLKNLSYDIDLVIDWSKSTNPVIDGVACSLKMTVGDNLCTELALTVNSIANMPLLSFKQVLVEVKYCCPPWFSLLHPHSLLDTKRLFKRFNLAVIKMPC